MKRASNKTQPKLEPDDLAELAPAIFDGLVFKFDTRNAVPGKEAPQLSRAIELIKAARSTGKLDRLSRECLQLKKFRECATNLQVRGSADLIGILKHPKAGILRDEIVPYAFAQIVLTISCDAFRAPTGCLMTDIVEHLEHSPSPPGECPKLLSFAVLCHDLSSEDENLKNIARDLEAWINDICAGTKFNRNVVRAKLPQQQAGRIHRLAIEIAWPPPLQSGIMGLKPLPEAYARWGIFRERMTINEKADRHQTVTDVLAESETQKRTGAWPVDHVEISIEPSNMQAMEGEWEYRVDVSINASNDVWQPFPICVRMLSNTARPGTRACPTKELTTADIIKIDDQKFHVRVQKTGVFVAATLESSRADTSERVRQALPHASIGLWSRKAFGSDGQDELCEALTNVRAEEIPRIVHELRSESQNHHIWRHVVLLFDPNLPQFRFSYEKFEASHQSRTNAALT